MLGQQIDKASRDNPNRTDEEFVELDVIWKIHDGCASQMGGELRGRQVVELLDRHYNQVAFRLRMGYSSKPPVPAESLEQLRLDGEYDIEHFHDQWEMLQCGMPLFPTCETRVSILKHIVA